VGLCPTASFRLRAYYPEVKRDPLRAQRILVVDDNVDLRDSLKRMLEQAGYDVMLARDGEDALQLQRQHPADVLLTDIFMPERDGLETIESFRRRYPKVRIIAMSGDAHLRVTTASDYLAVARVAGAHATLRKPFAAAALLDNLRGITLAGTAG
jgi:CheY-like chemotaxis protein